MWWLSNIVRCVELFVRLYDLLFDFLWCLVNLHLPNNLTDFLHVEHLPTIRISLQEEHHCFCSKWVNLVNSVVKHNALNDEVLQSLPYEHFLLNAVHGNYVAVEAGCLQNQKVF